MMRAAAILTVLLLAAGSAQAADVEQVFQFYCSQCHGEGGKGDGPTGKALAAAGQPAPRDFTVGDFKFDANKDGEVGTDADLAEVIKKGAAPYGGNPLMAPNPSFSDEDIANLTPTLSPRHRRWQYIVQHIIL